MGEGGSLSGPPCRPSSNLRPPELALGTCDMCSGRWQRRPHVRSQKAVIQSDTPAPSLMERAITRVVVEFWGRPRGFAALGLPRKGWGQVGPRHPFLRGVAGELYCGDG
jgi:hypothetical protein